MRNDDRRGSRLLRAAEDDTKRPGSAIAAPANAVEAVQYAGRGFRDFKKGGDGMLGSSASLSGVFMTCALAVEAGLAYR